MSCKTRIKKMEGRVAGVLRKPAEACLEKHTLPFLCRTAHCSVIKNQLDRLCMCTNVCVSNLKETFMKSQHFVNALFLFTGLISMFQ